MSALGWDDFTDDERLALMGALHDAQASERRTRMDQAEAFCLGLDEIAERYDGPDGHIAHEVRNVRALTGLRDRAFGVAS